MSPKWRLQRTAKQLLPDFPSLQKCYRVPRSREVQVWQSPSRKTAAFRGLCSCQSVTACPVCSARIASHRAEEITQGIATHRRTGGTCLLLTFTLGHTRDDELTTLLDRLRDASQSWRRQRAVRAVLSRWGLLGTVYGLECTFGHAAGFHPHRHTLAFIERDTGTIQDLFTLKREWVKAVEKAGGSATIAHGLDIRGGNAAGEYVAKLGLEVALAVRKKGRGDRFSPWQLLDLAESERWAGLVFAYYAQSMKGRTHLQWSRGLRHALHLGAELTDAEIMESAAEQDERLLAELTNALWKGIYRNELRGDLLRLLGIGELDEAAELLLAYGLDPSGLTVHSENASMEQS